MCAPPPTTPAKSDFAGSCRAAGEPAARDLRVGWTALTVALVSALGCSALPGVVSAARVADGPSPPQSDAGPSVLSGLLDEALQDAAHARAEAAAAATALAKAEAVLEDERERRRELARSMCRADKILTVLTDAPSLSPRRAALVDSFDDVVGLFAGKAFKCSGVLVTANLVATAKHCVPADMVVVGTSIEAARDTRKVLGTRLHPDPLVDLALLFVAPLGKVQIHERRATVDTEAPLGEGVVVGFGASDPAGATGVEVLRSGDVDLAGWGCSPHEAARSGCVSAHEMVVRGGASDTCRGDSGGALFERWSGGYRLVAITSRALPGRTACGQGGIYTRVDAVAAWLRDEIVGRDR